MFDVKLIDEKTQWTNLIKKVKELTDSESSVTEVGLFKDVGLITIAKENEFGDPPRMNRPYPIPERSFMRFVFDRDLDLNTKLLSKGIDDIITGTRTREKVLDNIGKEVTDSIRNFILDGYYQYRKPNHPITISKKGHTYPLIQKGKIVTMLTHKVGNLTPKETGKTTIRNR